MDLYLDRDRQHGRGATVVEPVTSDPAVVAAIARTDAIIVQEQTNPRGISLVPNATTILSGGAVDVVLQADPSQANKTFQYTISGIQSSEIQGGKLTGSVVLGTDSKATIHIGTITNAANLDTPNETIKVTVGPINTTTTLTEGTQTVSQTGPVNEGQGVQRLGGDEQHRGRRGQRADAELHDHRPGHRPRPGGGAFGHGGARPEQQRDDLGSHAGDAGRRQHDDSDGDGGQRPRRST
ncbi:MAG: hypothetical protein U1E60_14950 [Reyranellaceae bacterium]